MPPASARQPSPRRGAAADAGWSRLLLLAGLPFGAPALLRRAFPRCAFLCRALLAAFFRGLTRRALLRGLPRLARGPGRLFRGLARRRLPLLGRRLSRSRRL